MLHNYLKTAWKSLIHNKSLTALNVAGLTMGMTAAVLIFLWVQNELSFDRFEPSAERIYLASTRQTVPSGAWEGAPMLLAAAAHKEVPGIEKITRLNTDNEPVFRVGNDVQFEKQCAYVDSNWFDFFSYRFIEGGAADFERDIYSLVLTASEAKRYFGNRAAVGQIVRIDILNETAVRELQIHQPVLGQYFKWHGVQGRIIGVVKDFHFKSLHEKVGPLVVFNDPGWRHVYLVRTAAQRAAAAVAAVAAIWKRNFPSIPMQYQFLDEEFDRLYRQDAIAGRLVFIFTVIASCISALGLFGLAAFAAERREREIGIRRVLGATTASIGTLLSREFIRLVAIAILLATPLAWWVMNGWLQNFAYRVGLSWWMFALSGGMALAMAVLVTGWQAVKAAWKNPVRALRRE